MKTLQARHLAENKGSLISMSRPRADLESHLKITPREFDISKKKSPNKSALHNMKSPTISTSAQVEILDSD